MNFNAIVPKLYISSISYCIKMQKLPSYQMLQKPVNEKDLVLRAQFERFDAQCYDVNVLGMGYVILLLHSLSLPYH